MERSVITNLTKALIKPTEPRLVALARAMELRDKIYLLKSAAVDVIPLEFRDVVVNVVDMSPEETLPKDVLEILNSLKIDAMNDPVAMEFLRGLGRWSGLYLGGSVEVEVEDGDI